ncbi:hypothetical protein BDD12DRAFT_126903 [Trichophaea hybrida]|nr:hypothetical protein BDD12DRAFT_126903 [Trichophaea hybrida]
MWFWSHKASPALAVLGETKRSTHHGDTRWVRVTMTSLPPITRVAIIGAGASGLVAARALLEQKCFDTIDVFEQRSDVGGVWNYTPQTAPIRIPSTDVNVVEEPVEYVDDSGETRKVYVTAIYDSLETNIPKTLMRFSTHSFPASHPLFPSHSQVLSYLRHYAADLRHLITFNAHISSITITPVSSGGGWVLRFSTPHPPKTYDAIVIASGHYNTPFIPSIPGLTAWPSSHINHSLNFRSPLPYHNKKTLLIGGSISAFDIASRLLPHVTLPLLQSIRTPSPFPTPAGIKTLPEISAFREYGSVEFIDGHIEHGVEAVLFATGYLYTLPFLPHDNTTTGERVRGTWQHIFSIDHPTLAYIGLPTRVIPFPCAQSQAAVVARVWAGKTVLPTKEEMEAWERQRMEEGRKGTEGRVGGEGRGFHNFGYPDDSEYFDTLKGMVPRDGTGLEPTRWRKRERWIRERVAGIKNADLEAKERGVIVTRMEELGFIFEDDGKEEGEGEYYEKGREKV